MHTDELVDTVLDHRYRILRPLGQGGMGMVYLGEHVRTGRKCAVKLLPPEASHDVEAVKRFEREARVLGAMGHPGIVGIHDFSETPDGRPFFVMDYLEGEDLSQRLKRVGKLHWEDAKRVFDEISAALWAAHQAGVLHRDLKPGNVFLAQSPAAPERVVLLDFGLAKGGVQDALTLTQSNMVMGTPLYMSPEQARSVGVDARSDIYSLAALTFELLTGQPPFVGPNYTAVLSSLLIDPPPKLSEKATAAVPEHLDEVLDIALSKDPKDRQPDVASFATAVLQRRPAWADTTARAIESGLTPGAGLGIATGPPSAGVGSGPITPQSVSEAQSAADSASLQMAATVASSPDRTGPLEAHTAPSMASPSSLSPAQMLPVVTPAEPASSPRVTVDPAPTPVINPRPERQRRPWMLLAVIALVVLGGVGAAVAYWAGQRKGRPSSKGSATQATGPGAADATAAQLTPDASTPVAVSPDGGAAMAASNPIDELVNEKLKQAAKVFDGLSQKGAKETEKFVRKVVRGVINPPRQPATGPRPAPGPGPSRRAAGGAPPAPPMRRTGWTSPPGVKGALALAGYMRNQDWKGCVRAARRMYPSKTVLQMAVVCAVRTRSWGVVRTLCKKYQRRYPGTRYLLTCHSLLKPFGGLNNTVQRSKRNQKY